MSDEEHQRAWNLAGQAIPKPLAISATRRPPDKRAKALADLAPKIVDKKKYYGPAVTDFEAIRARMKELS